uniref:CRAL-TRIO domain-containing protein n=1 Tax=viral metagenome TaxID=1070528 RepID=A0A6C0F5D5_9ZZZZ
MLSISKNESNKKTEVDKSIGDFEINTRVHEFLKATKLTSRSQVPVQVTNDLLESFCHITNTNKIILDYRIFKYIARPSTYDVLIKHISSKINLLLKSNPTFSVHICTKLLTISGADKHILFIYKLTESLNSSYPDKLEKCYIYDAPFIFQKIIGMLSLIIDKKTLSKITIVNN